MKRTVLAVLMVLAAAAVYADDLPACGTPDKPEWCAELSTGDAVLVTNGGEKRDYVLAGLAVRGAVHGFGLAFSGDLMGEQDGGRLAVPFADPASFRVVSLDTRASKAFGEGKLALAAHGAVTLSVEGQVGSPVDARLWTAEAEATAHTKAGVLTVRGGHDGSVGGWAVGVHVEIPIPNAPALVADYAFPLVRQTATGPLPWVVTIGARMTVVKFNLAGLLK